MSRRKKLPKGWRWTKLGDQDIAEIGAGNSAPQGLEYFEGGIYPFVRTQDVGREGKTPCLVDTADKLNDYAVQTKTLRQWPETTILIPKSGASTFLNHRAMLGCPAYVASHLATVVPQQAVLPEFLYFFSLNIDARDIAPRNDYPSLRLPDIAGVEIPLPPLAVQERIVEVLQQADAIRRKRAEARRLADQILPALFLDMFGDLATNPKGWRVKKVGECTTLVTSGYTPRGGANNYVADGPLLLRSQNIKMLSFDLSDCAHLPESIFNEMERVHVQPGDVLMNITGKGTAGRVVWVDDVDLRAAVNQHVCIIRCEKDNILAPFLAIMLSTLHYQSIIDRAPGSTQTGFNHSRVRALEILVPPLPIQKNFVARLEALIQVTDKCVAGMNDIEATFQTLLSRAFTGELTEEWEAENADWIVERQTFYEHLPRLALLALLLERHERAGRNAETLIATLMKYVFLTQMEGSLHRRLYRFVPYYYGPCAMELYGDLEALANDGLIIIENDAEEDKTRIKLADPDRTAALLEEEAKKDDARLAAMDQPNDEAEAVTDPVMPRLLRRRTEILETLRTDSATILDAYGDLDHNTLLKTVYEKYPAYAKKSRLRKTTTEKSDTKTIHRGQESGH